MFKTSFQYVININIWTKCFAFSLLTSSLKPMYIQLVYVSVRISHLSSAQWSHMTGGFHYVLPHTQLNLTLFISLFLYILYSFCFDIFKNVDILNTKTESKFVCLFLKEEKKASNTSLSEHF